MSKKKTIPCDKCGARLDHIPEKCPHCGEEIAGRMDPRLMERIQKEFNRTSPRIVLALITFSFTAYYIALLVAYYSDNRINAGLALLSCPLFFGFPAGLVCLFSKAARKKAWYFLSGQVVILAASCIFLSVLVFNGRLAGYKTLLIAFFLFIYGGLLSVIDARAAARKPEVTTMVSIYAPQFVFIILVFLLGFLNLIKRPY